MKNKVFFVIGSNCFSGSHFVNYALNSGNKVWGISRSKEQNNIFLPYKWGYKKEISSDNDIYFICRFSDKQITINTKAPLVINLNTKSGFQPIIDHDDLNTNDNAQLINKESDGK